MFLDSGDLDLVVLLSSDSLDRSPKKNWVENSGSLPPYVRKIARGVEKSGKSLSQSIAIAIGQIKRWAAGGGDVNADTRAKAVKALAQWTALKAKNKAKQLVKATHLDDGSLYLFMSAPDVTEFDTDLVRSAWNVFQREARETFRVAHEMDESARKSYSPGDAMPVGYDNEFPYYYIKSLWTTYIVVGQDDERGSMLKIPYTVSDSDDVTFGTPEPVKFVLVKDDPETGNEEDFDTLSDNEVALLGAILGAGN